jgi:hypothetical protein
MTLLQIADGGNGSVQANLRRGDHLEDPGADGRIILKMDSLVSQNTKNFLTS